MSLTSILKFTLAAAALLLALPQALAAPYKAEAGPYPVETLLGAWTDAARDGRSVPYKVYYAPAAEGPQPVVIFSHGLGGSRDGAAYLGQHFASHGYAVVYLQHAGSDESVWSGLSGREAIIAALAESVKNPANAIARFRDLPFAVTSLSELNASGPLAGRLDLTRIGMSGHSYGAVSTLVAAGQRLGPRAQFSLKEPRIAAAIAYSPNLPNNARDLAAAFADVDVSIFHMTGTKDGSPLDPAMDPAQRQEPYRLITKAPQFLLVLQDGDHMVFSGRTRNAAPVATDGRHQSLILQASLAYWDAMLRGDKAAQDWLTGTGFTAELGTDGTFAFKP